MRGGGLVVSRAVVVSIFHSDYQPVHALQFASTSRATAKEAKAECIDNKKLISFLFYFLPFAPKKTEIATEYCRRLLEPLHSPYGQILEAGWPNNVIRSYLISGLCRSNFSFASLLRHLNQRSEKKKMGAIYLTSGALI